MQTYNHRYQRGLTLGELMIWLGAFAAVSVVLGVLGAGILSAVRIEQANRELHAAITAAQSYRNIEGSYTGIDVEALVDNGYNLHGFDDGDDENVYGGDLVIAPTTGGADAEFDYETDDSKACEQLESRIEEVSGITVAPACDSNDKLEFTIN